MKNKLIPWIFSFILFSSLAFAVDNTDLYGSLKAQYLMNTGTGLVDTSLSGLDLTNSGAVIRLLVLTT